MHTVTEDGCGVVRVGEPAMCVLVRGMENCSKNPGVGGDVPSGARCWAGGRVACPLRPQFFSFSRGKNSFSSLSTLYVARRLGLVSGMTDSSTVSRMERMSFGWTTEYRS